MYLFDTVSVWPKQASNHRFEMVWTKYFNNLVEQDHRFIKRRVRPMVGFKSFTSAASAIAAIAAIELVKMIRKGQF